MKRRKRIRRRRLALTIGAGAVSVASFLWGFALGSDVEPEPAWRVLADEGAFG